jgi:dihydrofolate synthase / folylpolyglutamate synthase
MIESKFISWDQIVNYLQTFIPSQTSTKGYVAKDWGLSRTKRFLTYLKDPQEKMQVFHIGGTSGKGSTSFLTSQILSSQGLKTGLHLSPYLLDFRERFIIDNELPSEDLLVKRFNEFHQFLIKFLQLEETPLTYFEIINCWAFYLFEKEKVDVAVIEVGMGGRFDATNCVQNPNKICIINQTGLDHTEFLGETVEEIATEEAEIIQPENPVVLIQQQFSKAQNIFLQKIKEQNSKYSLVKGNWLLVSKQEEDKSDFPKVLKQNLIKTLDNLDFKVLDLSQNHFEYFSIIKQKWIQIYLKMKGDFQVVNTSLAFRAVEIYFQQKNLKFDFNSALKILKQIQFRGRFEEILVENKVWILDSAHNSQKMTSFIKNLKKYYPNQKFIFFLAFSDGKNFKEMLDLLLDISDIIIFTNFKIKTQGASKKSLKLEEIEEYLREQNQTIKTFFISDPFKAFLKTKEIYKQSQKKLVVTGSIYFLSQVYEILETK